MYANPKREPCNISSNVSRYVCDVQGMTGSSGLQTGMPTGNGLSDIDEDYLVFGIMSFADWNCVQHCFGKDFSEYKQDPTRKCFYTSGDVVGAIEQYYVGDPDTSRDIKNFLDNNKTVRTGEDKTILLFMYMRGYAKGRNGSQR